MNCERVRNLISAYLDRELSPEEFRLIRAHLVTCDSCNRELEAEAALKEALGGLESHEAPEGLLPGVLRRLSQEKVEGRQRLSFHVVRWAAVGAAAAAVLVALPLARQWRSGEHVIEAHSLYRQHSLVSAAQPLSDRALAGYYFATAGGDGRGSSAARTADRVKLVGQLFPE